LIEFPSVLLPPGAAAGSIVNISVHQNHAEEEKRDTEFWSLQEDIMGEFGKALPAYPELKVSLHLILFHSVLTFI
jgi:chitin biosynthesis protein CHS5